VPSPLELCRRPYDVLVDGMRLGPGKRRHHADAQTHWEPILVPLERDTLGR
jgi:hypothetical protein